jgi:phage shock protein PspC (stress-responsive transcriptional regulator)
VAEQREVRATATAASPMLVRAPAGVQVPARATPTPPAERGQQGRMTRRRGGRVLAGVAGGLADHLGVKVLWVRAAFALLCALSGAGLLAYGLLWVFVPQRAAEDDVEAGAKERQQAFGLLALGCAAGTSGRCSTRCWPSWRRSSAWRC